MNAGISLLISAVTIYFIVKTYIIWRTYTREIRSLEQLNLLFKDYQNSQKKAQRKAKKDGNSQS